MNTGENAEALRKITDLTRKCSIIILALHFYVYCYAAFQVWHLTHPITERLMENLHRTGLFDRFYISKLGALLLLLVSLVGTTGKKNEKLAGSSIVTYLGIGLVFYWCSYWLFFITAPSTVVASVYMLVTGIGFLLVLHGGALLSRLLKNKLNKDIFNRLQETFPQEERLLNNEYSVNLPALYNLKGKLRRSWINIINPFRGLLVAGTPGSR